MPVADALEQRRTPVESALDVETSVEPPDDVPLEAAPADWQEQLEAVELDPELDELHRDDFQTDARWPIPESNPPAAEHHSPILVHYARVKPAFTHAATRIDRTFADRAERETL